MTPAGATGVAAVLSRWILRSNDFDVELPARSRAVHVTVVRPTAKTEPVAGEQTTVSVVPESVAVGYG